MRVAFVGGTGFLGSVAVPLALACGHELVVAHSGTHELPEPISSQVEHLHGSRDELLAPRGPLERVHPDVIIDTFRGATADKARQLASCANACGARVVAVSSCDVYQASLDAGMGDARFRAVLAPSVCRSPRTHPGGSTHFLFRPS